VKQLIGIVPQDLALYPTLSGRENLRFFGEMYNMSGRRLKERVETVLEIVGMRERANDAVQSYSGGMKRRINLAAGLMNSPRVLFLDEPTLGLDVGAARDVRNFVRQWIDTDTSRTLLLTTHYMVEADELCDRVAIINQGRVLACDKPSILKHRLQQDAIFQLEVSPLNGLGVEALEALPGVKKVTRHDFDGGARLEFILAEEPVVGTVVSTLTEKNVRILNFQKREPTLEDVFVELVGRSMAEEEHSNE